MGFIFGIISLSENSVDTNDVYKLCTAVKWDNFDEYIDIHGQYSIGYCWNKERTPKAGIYKDENLTVIADARIYNTDALRKEITFTTSEEAFARAYLKWGKQCPDKFNGDFSVVIIDHKHQEVILFRDHIGARPLCYTIKNNQLIFASHEYGIAKSHLINNTLSEEKLVRGFFHYKKQKYHLTVFQHILKVTPGYSILFSSKNVSNIQYWFPEKIKRNRRLSIEDTIVQLRQQLIKSTQKRMSDKIIGTHLSGGLDSSGVAAILADLIENKSKLIGYSWSPENSTEEIESVNEKELIDDFVEKKSITVRYLTWGEENVLDELSTPEFEKMPIEMQTMRMAQENNVSSIFSGWGGDEFVSISTRGALNHIVLHCKIKMLIKWIKHFGIKSSIARARMELFPLLIPFGRGVKIALKRKWIHFFSKSFILKHYRLFFFNQRKQLYGWGNRTRSMIKLLHFGYLPNRMDSWTLFGEKFGIEYKYPLLDKELLEFWLSVPTEFTYQTMSSRYLYREALKDILPEKIRTRKNKDEDVLEKKMNNYFELMKKEVINHPELFSTNKQLPFFQEKEFQKIAITPANDIITKITQRLDINYYLRYRKIQEKYLASKQ